jgi:hypothetical protein
VEKDKIVIKCDKPVKSYLFKGHGFPIPEMESDDDNNNSKEDDHPSFLPHISTLYTRRSAKLIRSAEKSTLFMIIAIAVLVVMSLLDTFEVESLEELLPIDSLDVFISIFSLGVLAVMGLMLRTLLKSRNTLERWADIFEQNAMRSSLSIALSSKSKEEVVRALPEVVEELHEPLQSYISKGVFDEFFDVWIENGKNRLDILIDSQRIIASKDQLNLKQLLSEYGAITVQIIDKSIDEKDVSLFSDILRKYKVKSGNDVGLAILICSKISPSAESYVKKSRDFLTRKIVMVEISDYELQQDDREQGNLV